jgi:hypothetical protein
LVTGVWASDVSAPKAVDCASAFSAAFPEGSCAESLVEGAADTVLEEPFVIFGYEKSTPPPLLADESDDVPD